MAVSVLLGILAFENGLMKSPCYHFNAAYVFRQNEEPLAYRIFPSEDGELIHASCTVTPNDAEFPLYADDLQRCACDDIVECFYCGQLIPEAMTCRAYVQATRETAENGTSKREPCTGSNITDD